MSHNLKRAAAMQQKSNKELVNFWMAMTLSSDAAAYVLKQRGIELPVRNDETRKMAQKGHYSGKANSRE